MKTSAKELTRLLVLVCEHNEENTNWDYGITLPDDVHNWWEKYKENDPIRIKAIKEAELKKRRAAQKRDRELQQQKKRLELLDKISLLTNDEIDEILSGK